MIKPYTAILYASLDEVFSLEKPASVIAVDLHEVLDTAPARLSHLFACKTAFLFYVEEPQKLSLSPEQRHVIISFFFSKNYHTINDGPALILKRWNGGGVVNQLELDAKLQGWQTLPLLCGEKMTGFASVQHVPVVQEVVKPASNTFLESFDNPSNYIFFQGSSFGESCRAEAAFFNKLQLHLDADPLLTQVASHYYELKKSHAACSSLLRIAEAKLHNANAFVELAKTKYKDDYVQLFQYYQDQYEVLPLWYKRFGHIIKVFMGKRSLKSLFHDRPKKETT